jgi:hypothetical protein
MTPRFIAVDQTSAQEIIQERSLQSTEFQEGREFANWLANTTFSEIVRPRYTVVATGGGIFFISPRDPSKKVLVIDYERAPIFSCDDAGGCSTGHAAFASLFS